MYEFVALSVYLLNNRLIKNAIDQIVDLSNSPLIKNSIDQIVV